MKNITPILLPGNTIQVKLCGNIINILNLKNIEFFVSDKVFNVYLNSNLALKADLEKGEKLKFNNFIKAIVDNDMTEEQKMFLILLFQIVEENLYFFLIFLL